MRRLLPFSLALFLLAPLAVNAATSSRAVPGAVAATSIVSAALPERSSGPWQAFESRHGRWEARWNRLTGSPHRAFGRGIALAGFRDDAPSAEQAVRGFIAGEQELFGTPELERVAATRANGRWYVRFRQTVEGLPVLFADWEFRVGANGKLSAFGADAIRATTVEEGGAPAIAAGVARAAATLGLEFDPARDQVSGGETLWLLPVRGESGLTLRRVLEVRVDVQTMPPARWVALVDAVTGEVRMRFDRVRHNITGAVSGGVHPNTPFDPLSSVPMKYQFVTVGGSTVATNAAGVYDIASAGTQTLTARFRGNWVDVNRQDAADAAFTTSVTDPQVQDVVWTSVNSHDAERDGYHHTTLVHDYIKALDPPFTGVDYIMPCAVNIASTCNAFWDGTGINFYLAGGGCPNTASMPSVVYHEYGHGVNDQLYLQQGAPFGMTNGALHEGLADVLSAMIEDTPEIGRGFFGAGTHLRNVDNTNHWPEDDGGSHFAGQMIGGALWDLRQSAGLATAASLSHFAKYGLPDDADNGEALHEYYVETLVADDDDADLSNGTPNAAAIAAAFNAHGIGSGFFVDITHTALTDTPDHGPFLVAANILYSGPFSALDAASPTLHYSVNGSAWETVPMTPSGAPNQFRANLPGTFVGLIRYYITAADQLGGSFAFPRAAPTRGVISFLAGPVSPVFTQNLEADPGWTIGSPDDNATTGIWIRANPVGAFVGSDASQPEDDHTPAGTICFITGNAAAGAGAGTNDVDNGQTTLTTNVFSALGVTTPLIEFYQWYRNDLGGAPASDTFHVDISSDGGASWVTVADVEGSAGAWTRAVYRIEEYVAPTANMRVRFRAADFGTGSLVEAGVDDFRLLGVTGSVDVVASATGLDFRISAAPNPFQQHAAFRWTLPEAADVSLSIYDAAGRRVRDMARGRLSAGTHSLLWDGRDDQGRAVGAGVYWMRLQAGGREASARVARLP